MKVAFVVQRCGLEVNGGAELHCRQVAERMSKYWDVEILTTCAIDYMTWQNEYPPGPASVSGIPVRRFLVDAPRDVSAFNRLSAVVLAGGAGERAELEWMRTQGPVSSALLDYLRGNLRAYDFFIFFTYLYASTFFGLPLVADRSALVPTAHDEPPIYLEIFKDFFRLPRVFLFNTPEEQAFINHRFGTAATIQDVVGVGMERPEDVMPDRFLRAQAEALEGRAFILYVGRLDVSKGCRQLFSHFIRFREDRPELPVKLVLMGRSVMEIPSHPDIVSLGFVGDREKFEGLAAASVVVLPSPYESLSMTALEAWSLGTPVLANGATQVLQAQCLRSNGGLWYENYAEFRETLALLLSDRSLRERLGAAGQAFVNEGYRWEAVEAKYLALVGRVMSGHAS